MGSILGHLRLRVQPWIQRSRVCMVGSWPLLAAETGMSYDVAGNLLNDGASTYFYDAESRIQTGAGVTYTYDGDGKRVQKSTGKLYWYGMASDPPAERCSYVATKWFFNGLARAA